MVVDEDSNGNPPQQPSRRAGAAGLKTGFAVRRDVCVTVLPGSGTHTVFLELLPHTHGAISILFCPTMASVIAEERANTAARDRAYLEVRPSTSPPLDSNDESQRFNRQIQKIKDSIPGAMIPPCTTVARDSLATKSDHATSCAFRTRAKVYPD